MDTEGVRIARITITRTFHPERDANNADVIDVESDSDLALLDQLGMLEFAKLSVAAEMITDRDPDSD